MGIAPYKTFTFDGESSGDYGVYITGTGVFNAPKRSVEMVEIAGRNGSFALDKGKFENIEVKYKVGIVDDSEADFADRVSDFRNWLCSKVGYCRLEDEYNPNEYRMGVYSSGVEIDHDLLIAGEAEITFNCKPQRWLTSGETAVSVADGGTLDNPTLFPSSPLLAVKGYGNIDIGGQGIEVENVLIGEIAISTARTVNTLTNVPMFLDDSQLNSGDDITVSGAKITVKFTTTSSSYKFEKFNLSSSSGCSVHRDPTGTRSRTLDIYPNNMTFDNGTSSTESCTVSLEIKLENTTTVTRTVTCSFLYNGSDGITVSTTLSSSISHVSTSGSTSVPSAIGNSTKSALGNPMYIDLDIGECWNEDSGTPVSVNNAVALGSDLPKLPTGQTTFNYDNTITSFKVTPRWWKV